MKVCNRCKEAKPFSEFHKNKTKEDGMQPRCKLCVKASDAAYYIKHKQKIQPARAVYQRAVRRGVAGKIQQFKLASRCAVCGESEPACLDFHHLDPATKDFTIGEASSHGASWNKVKIEIAKCLVLCANCHRKVHVGVVQLKA